MSDIPRARQILRTALQLEFNADPHFLRRAIRTALKLMTRETPQFRVSARKPKMTRDQVERARQLRRAEMSVDDIGKRIGQNIGRVSEAINGKRKGI